MSVKKPTLVSQFKIFLRDGEDWEAMPVGIPNIAIQRRPEYIRNKKTYPSRLGLILLRDNGSSFRAPEINLKTYMKLVEAFNHEKFEKLMIAVDKFNGGSIEATKDNGNKLIF